MNGNEVEWDRIYKHLNGYKKFIHGNHDSNKKIEYYINRYDMEDIGLASLYSYSKKRKFYLSHYPTYTMNYEDKKNPLINLFGHTHQKNNFFNNNPYMYHVGLDSHNCTPVSIEEIIQDIKKYLIEKKGG